MPTPQITTVPTVPFRDQRPGTSGLRKKTREFMQPNYLANFVQSVFDAIRGDSSADFSAKTLVIGGDGRYYNRPAIHAIIRIAAGNGFGRVLVAREGILSTPAMSAVIRRRKALGGLILSASHNPGGPDEDFGIKYNIENGGPAPEQVTERIFRETLKIDRYFSVESPDVDIDREGSLKIAGTEVVIFDPLADYTALMEELFDFAVLRAHFQSGFRMLFDAMHGATGPYARHIFENRLGAPPGTVLNGDPLEDFGGHHPDPNLVYAADLVGRRAGFRSGMRRRRGPQHDSGPEVFRKSRRLVGADCRTRGVCHPGLSRRTQRRSAIVAHQHRCGSGSAGSRYKILRDADGLEVFWEPAGRRVVHALW